MRFGRIRKYLLIPKWEFTRFLKVRKLKKHRRSPQELFSKYKEIHEEFLIKERKDKDKENIAYFKGQLKALEWAMGEEIP